MPFWSVTSTTLSNEIMYVNNTYKDENGKNKLTTIGTDNPTVDSTGYIPINPSSTDPIIKKLSYSIQTDGKITYRYDDGTGNKIQYNSIQEIANDFGISGYTAATTAKIKSDMQKNLSSSASEKKVGPSIAPPPPPTQLPDGSTPTTSTPITQETLTDLAKGIPGTQPRLEYDNLTYPKDLKLDNSDAIQFTMVTYGTKTFKNDQFGLGNRDLTQQIKGSVTMSIQPTISDANSVRWSPSEMGPIATSAADSSLTLIEEGAQGLASIENKIAGTLGKEGPSIAKAIIAAAAGEASGTKGLLTRVTGAMFNNNLELLFQGPELRQFTFTFKLSPRYEVEANEVKKIIRFFKQGSAVQRSSSNLFLKSPNVFNIRYLKGNANHKSLNKIKTCALVNCGVDYTPTGSYMTFNDNDASMVSYTLSLTFNELEPVYEDEYQKLSLEEIGY